MDPFDIVMILFFLVIPVALIVCAVLLVRTKQALSRAAAEIRALQMRLSQAEAANSTKNGNQSNRL